VVSEDLGQGDIRSLWLRTKHWTEIRFQSSSKILLKVKGKRRHHKRRVLGSDQMAQKCPSLFKMEFIVCKSKQQEKSGTSLQEELGWLTGLIDKVLSHNMGHFARGLMTIPSFLIVCRTCDQCQVLSRGLYLKCQIEYRVPLPGICHFLV
jgi:hypothetical protein